MSANMTRRIQIPITYAIPNEHLRSFTYHHVHTLRHKLLLPRKMHVSARRNVLPGMYPAQRPLELRHPRRVAVRHDIHIPEPRARRTRPHLLHLVHNLLDRRQTPLEVHGHAGLDGALGLHPRVGERVEAVERVEVRAPVAQVLAVREEVAQVGTCGSAGDLAAPDPGGWHGAQDGGDGAVVELVEPLLCAVPVCNTC